MNMPSAYHGAATPAEWLRRWTDLESRLTALLLAAPSGRGDWPVAFSDWLKHARSHLDSDTDAGLFWIFRLASTTRVGYSSIHALLCWALARVVSPALALSAADADTLERAALTMNIGMTRLQNLLAMQTAPITPSQRTQIDAHPSRSVELLQSHGVKDERWLFVVKYHHDTACLDFSTRVLQRLDRYGALISPRQTRDGRHLVETGHHLTTQGTEKIDDVGRSIVHELGLFPPGTLVRLADDSTAIALRRGENPGDPQVAVIFGPDGKKPPSPFAVDTRQPEWAVVSALHGTSVADVPPIDALLPLLFATRDNAGL